MRKRWVGGTSQQHSQVHILEEMPNKISKRPRT
ncbi:hypothetical protein L286_03695 [Sphingobium sp. HDIP04]|nr:hypothetical protein L286_04125 [Sphingobium sp. HDIP04]EQB07331.1 hypothetical protein L286_03990 [Sphingobium sp. HDIP04]EQB07434.1 hypothetical protein L286_03695 [Sphingobium sp. HDIP04]